MSTDPKTAVSQAQPTVGRFAEILSDQYTPEQQEAYRSLIDAEGLKPGAALPSAPLKIWIRNPKLSKAIAPLILYLHPSHNSLSLRERELQCASSPANGIRLTRSMRTRRLPRVPECRPR